uniref:J domain-containing protein n=1 Tax=Ditylenchus dipsaci TaxID=166011 RepID=A0A915DZC2_9BILA
MNRPSSSCIPRKNWFLTFRQCPSCQNRFYSSSFSKRSPYEVLGLKSDASQSEIKNAFYTLSKKFHPDVTGSSAESSKKFLEIKEAYDNIKDEAKRKQFDSSFSSRTHGQQHQQYGHPYQQNQQRPQNSSYGSGSDWFRDYQQNYYRRSTDEPPFERNKRPYTREDYERIWRQMQSRKFQNDFSEFIRRATQNAREDVNRQRERRWQKTTEQTEEQKASNEQTRKNVAIISKIMSLYIVIFTVSILYQMSRRKIPVEPNQSYDYRSSNDRISQMMSRPPN